MNKRQHKKALKKALESNNPKKIHELTHRKFLKTLKENIRGYEELIKSDLPNCSSEVREMLEKTAGNSSIKSGDAR